MKIFSWLRWLADHAFFAFLFLFFISLILGAIMFYRYDILVQQIEPEPEVALIEFKEELYQDVLKEWQVRQEKFDSAASQSQRPGLFWIESPELTEE